MPYAGIYGKRATGIPAPSPPVPTSLTCWAKQGVVPSLTLEHRRVAVLTHEGAATAPPQVEHDRIDQQSGDRDENDQKSGHHDLLPGMLSAGKRHQLGKENVCLPQRSRQRASPA